MVEITLPEMGEGIEKATISYWYVKEGDQVNEGDDLVEVSTDKATFNVPATVSGKIMEILVEEGDEVKVGEILVKVDIEV